MPFAATCGLPGWPYKEPSAKAGDIRNAALIPGLGRSPGGGHGNPLQYSCLENPMDREAWRGAVHRVAKSQTWLKRLSMHACNDMEEPRDCHAEWSKSEREGEILYDIPYMQNLKRNDTNELIYKTEQTHRLREWINGCRAMGECGEEWEEEIGSWDWHVYSAMFKMDNQQGPTV